MKREAFKNVLEAGASRKSMRRDMQPFGRN